MKKNFKVKKMIMCIIITVFVTNIFSTPVLAAQKSKYVTDKKYTFVNSDGLIAIAYASHNLCEDYNVQGSSRTFYHRHWFWGVKQAGVVGIPRVTNVSPKHMNGNNVARTFSWGTEAGILPGGLASYTSVGNSTSVTYANNTPIISTGSYSFNDTNFNPTVTPIVVKVPLGN
ncbi:hypothetical protein ABXS75_12130 [Roseburia hominis]